MKRALLTSALIALSLTLCITSSAHAAISPPEDTWLNKTPMPKSDYGLRAAAVDGKIYVIGGSINLEYNPANDSWATKTAMPTPRNWFSIAVLQNRVYTFGGRNAEGASLNSIEVYTPATDTWTVLAPMAINASSIDANVVDGKIYLIGLPDSKAAFSVNLAYDAATNGWTNKTTMPTPVNAYTSAVFNGKIYVFGGFDATLGATRTCNQTQIYDPSSDTWTAGSPVPGPVLGIATCATTGTSALKRIYIFGGSEGINGVNVTQVYSPQNDSWSFGSLMLITRAYPAVAAVNDQIYVFGGSPYLVFCPAITATHQYTPYGYGTTDSQSSDSTGQPELPFLLIATAVIAVAACGSVLLIIKKR